MLELAPKTWSLSGKLGGGGRTAVDFSSHAARDGRVHPSRGCCAVWNPVLACPDIVSSRWGQIARGAAHESAAPRLGLPQRPPPPPERHRAPFGVAVGSSPRCLFSKRISPVIRPCVFHVIIPRGPVSPDNIGERVCPRATLSPGC